MVSLLRVYNYSGLPHSIISELARKLSRHSPYDLANVKGCWEHHWKASPKGERNSRMLNARAGAAAVVAAEE